MVMLLSAFALMGFTTNVSAYADSKAYFSDEKYTESDFLLCSDGSESYKNIQTFSNEVKSASIGTSFPELTQVIPSQILENSQETVSQYYGKEYGYYVVKEGDYVDVLLLDFEYEFDDGEEHSNEYIIKIKPLLQQRFLKFYNEGQYHWLKENNFYKYYVANPRFFISLQNENSLNYGDPSYTKADDKGAAIVQTRLNYGRVSYKDEEDFINEGLKIAGKKLLDYTIKTISIEFPLVGVIKDAISNNLDIYKQGQEQIVIADNEDNIISLPGINNQKTDSQYLSYSRTAAFLPEDEIILSADENSYADYIVRIDEPDGGSCISRLDQICEFDIVRRNGNYSSMEHVAGNWYDEDDQALTFSKQRILFEDQEPQFNITENNIEGEDIPVYLLQSGRQKIAFSPDYSGYYNFETDADVSVSVTDGNGNEVASEQGDIYLRMGRTYTLTLSNSKNEKVISDLSVNLADRAPDKETSANEKIILRVNFHQDDVYKLSTGNSNVLIKDILVGGVNGLESCDNFYDYKASENISLPLSEGEYFIVVQVQENNAECNFSVFGCEEKVLGEEVAVTADGKNYVFVKFSGVTEGKYAIASDSSDKVTYRIYDYSLNRVAFSGANNSGSFNISSNIIYVGVLANSNINFTLNSVGIAYEWRIDDNKIDLNAENELEIGRSYEIELYVNGIKQDSSYFESDNEYCIITSDSEKATLEIKGQCNLGVQCKIDYQVGEVRPFDCDLVLKTKYTTAFNGFDIVNDEQILLEWVHGKDLVEINYTMSKPDGSGDEWEQNYCIEPTNNAVIGQKYSNDLTSQVEGINKVLADVTITINEIKVQMPDGLRSFTMDELGLVSEYTVNCFYGDGFGTQGDPYEISCNRHFENLGLNTYSNTHFTITKYLELEGNVVENFKGIIDNNNLTILKWTPKDAQEMGIFINNSGTIRNLQVNINYNFDLTGLWGHTVGGIVCNNKETGIIEDCSVTMLRASKLGFTSVVGGIVGVNDGTIRDCWATADVTTYGTFGVIAGINNGTITGCCGMGDVIQKVDTYEGCYELSQVGGIAGINGKDGKICNCVGGTWDDSYLSVVIDVEYNDDEDLAPYSGPIAGENKGEISECSNNGYNIDTGNLHSWWAWFHDYDQLKNINNTI